MKHVIGLVIYFAMAVPLIFWYLEWLEANGL